jgi:hypothetical protein
MSPYIVNSAALQFLALAYACPNSFASYRNDHNGGDFSDAVHRMRVAVLSLSVRQHFARSLASNSIVLISYDDVYYQVPTIYRAIAIARKMAMLLVPCLVATSLYGVTSEFLYIVTSMLAGDTIAVVSG